MITQSDVERIATSAAEMAIQKMLLTLGVDASNPKETLELQKDFAHIRESRLAMAAIKMKAWLVITGVVMTGALTTIYVALTSKGH